MFRTSGILLLLLASTIPPSAQQQVSTPPPSQETLDAMKQGTTREVAPLRMALKTSRSQAPSDASFGVVAEIENVSDLPVYLDRVTLILPPEIDPISGVLSYWDLSVPTASDQASREGFPSLLLPGSRTLAIVNLLKQPGTYQEEPSTDQSEPSTDQKDSKKTLSARISRHWQQLQFVPGDYTLRLVCSYRMITKEGQNSPPLSQVAETTLPVVAAQTTVLAGAAIGGLMAFILLPNLWLPITKDFSKITRLHWTFVILRGVAMSCLLSVMVSILLSRMSDSTFLIKVSVQDFWGAITVGFLAGTSGTAVLQRFTIWQAEQQKRLVQRGLAPSPPGDTGVAKPAEGGTTKPEELPPEAIRKGSGSEKPEQEIDTKKHEKHQEPARGEHQETKEHKEAEVVGA